MDVISVAKEGDEIEQQANFPRIHALAGFFGCMARTVEFLHRHVVRHMDIKPLNFLVKRIPAHPASHVGYKIYIADFGISRSHEQLAESETESPVKSYTHKYAAPEIVDQSKRGLSSDIFSLGCVFVDMLAALTNEHCKVSSDLPSALKSEYSRESYHENTLSVSEWVQELLRENVRNHFFSLLSPLAWHITDMLDPEPADRPTAGTVVSWFEQGDRPACCIQYAQPNILSFTEDSPNQEDIEVFHEGFVNDAETAYCSISRVLLDRLNHTSGLKHWVDVVLVEVGSRYPLVGGPELGFLYVLQKGEMFHAITQLFPKPTCSDCPPEGSVSVKQTQDDSVDRASLAVRTLLRETKRVFQDSSPKEFTLLDLFGTDIIGHIKVLSVFSIPPRLPVDDV
jgi:serine/threonine protein kinase